MKYIKRDGTTAEWLPRLEDYIEDDQEATVAQTYAVQMLDEDLKVVATEFLLSNSYPKELTLKWCLLKYRTKGAVYASVKKLHTLEY